MEPLSFAEYEASLAIPRELLVPDLSPEEIRTITSQTFRPSSPGPADLFLLFGTDQCDWQGVVEMYEKGWFSKAMLPGRVGPSLFSQGKPISHHMRDRLMEAGLPGQAILIEDRSMNTLEDVVFSQPILEKAGIVPGSILFGAKAHHSGRCYLTLRRFYPAMPIFAFTWPARYGDLLVQPDTWSDSEVARARVYGEYQRILTYSNRGDIAPFDPDDPGYIVS